MHPVPIPFRQLVSHSPPPFPTTASNDIFLLGYMHLSYFATEITLHRAIIRSLASQSLSAASSTTSLFHLPTPPPSDSYLTHICRSAAKTRLISAMDFVNRLRPHHLAAFWYFPSRTGFALVGTFGALLQATAPCREEVDFYITRLAEYRWTLGVSCQEAKWLRHAVESLERAEELLGVLPRRPSAKDVKLDISAACGVALAGIDENRRAGLEGMSGLVSPSVSTDSEEVSGET